MPYNHLILCCPLLLLSCSFPTIRVFPNVSPFAPGGQSIGASASASVLPMNIQGWFLLGLTGLITLWSKGHSKSPLQNHNLKASILWHSAFSKVQLSHPYMNTGKTIALTIWTFISKVVSLLFNMLSIFVTENMYFPGGPLVKTMLLVQEAWVWSLVRELDPACFH